MPRPKLSEPKIPVTIYLPQSLYMQLELVTMDLSRGRGKYGVRSRLVESLIRQWLRSRAKKKEVNNANQ